MCLPVLMGAIIKPQRRLLYFPQKFAAIVNRESCFGDVTVNLWCSSGTQLVSMVIRIHMYADLTAHTSIILGMHVYTAVILSLEAFDMEADSYFFLLSSLFTSYTYLSHPS